jgi:hypothetical protein
MLKRAGADVVINCQEQGFAKAELKYDVIFDGV